MIRLMLGSLIATAVLLGAGEAAAATKQVLADADTYVKENNKTYGGEPFVAVSKGKKAKNVRKGLISFSGVSRGVITDASLALTVERVDSSGTETVHVYGIRDPWVVAMEGHDGCQEFFDEHGVKHDQLAYLDGSGPARPESAAPRPA